MSPTQTLPRPASDRTLVRRDAVREAWLSLRRSGLVAPELPTIVFVALASSASFWWGLAAGGLTLVAVLLVRRRRELAMSPVLGATISLVIAAAVANRTGAASSGVLADVGIDLGIAVILAGSIVVRQPLFGVLWSLAHRRPLHRQPDRIALEGYYLTTGFAASLLLLRSLVLFAVYTRGEPVALLLGVKLVLGVPVTLLVVAAAYAAGGLDGARDAPTHPVIEGD